MTDEQIKQNTYGYLTPIEGFSKPYGKSFHRWWRCLCVCGQTIEIKETYLLNDGRKSCGCLRKYLYPRGNEHSTWRGYGEIPLQQFNRVKCRAKKYELEFTITIELVWEKFLQQERKCALTGLPLKFTTLRAKKMGQEQTASLDRIDSDKGYVEGNVQWLHKDVNMLKRDFDQNYFVELCRLIAATIPPCQPRTSPEQPLDKVGGCP